MDVNGLPIVVLVVLVGVALVVAAWLAMRFGRVIALFLAGGGILTVIVLGAVALAGQSASNFQTARAATEAAQAAKSASVGMTVLALGAVGCIGALGTVAVGGLGAVGVMYYRLQAERTARRLPRRQPARALPEPQQQPVVWYVEGGQQDQVDLSSVDLEKWGW